MILPLVGVVALLLWFFLPTTPRPDSPWSFALPCYSSIAQADFSGVDYGLWQHVPSFLQQGYWTLILSALCAALAVYLMAELNNANVLLRVSSRMLSSMLAILLAFAILCHRFQPGSVVMLLSLLSFFPLFATYQMPHPMPTFVAYLLLSVASLIFPKLLWMVPAYWGLQIYLRAFSFRCLVASLLAILLPYWFYGGIAVITSSLPDLVAHARAVIDFQWYGYATLNRNDLLTFAFVLLLFLSGTIDFYLHSFLDKTRTRILHHVIILHGLFVTLLQCLMPQYVSIFLPLLLVDAAILFGHFFTLTHTRFSHLYNLFLLALALLVVAAQYVTLFRSM